MRQRTLHCDWQRRARARDRGRFEFPECLIFKNLTGRTPERDRWWRDVSRWLDRLNQSVLCLLFADREADMCRRILTQRRNGAENIPRLPLRRCAAA